MILLAGLPFQTNLYSPVLIVAAIIAAMIVSFVPILSYPFRLLFTIIHELSHGFVAELTGGHFVKFELSGEGSGVAYTAGGTGCLIKPAGYLGTAFFSAGLILLGGFDNIAAYALGALGGLLILFVLIYGWTSPLALFSGLLLGSSFIGVAGWASQEWSIFSLNFLAVIGGLTAIDDVRILTLLARYRLPIKNDANDMAHLVGCPALFWAALWFLLSLAIIGSAIWLTWFRNE